MDIKDKEKLIGLIEGTTRGQTIRLQNRLVNSFFECDPDINKCKHNDNEYLFLSFNSLNNDVGTTAKNYKDSIRKAFKKINAKIWEHDELRFKCYFLENSNHIHKNNGFILIYDSNIELVKEIIHHSRLSVLEKEKGKLQKIIEQENNNSKPSNTISAAEGKLRLLNEEINLTFRR